MGETESANRKTARADRPVAPDETSLLLIRFSGDLTTKADATRRRMTSRLVENLRASLKQSGREGKVIRERNRIFVQLKRPDAARRGERARPSDTAVAERLARVFGVQAVAVCHAVEVESLEDVIREGEAFGRPHVQGLRYAIRARRVGDKSEVAIRPSQVERRLGSALAPGAGRVDLTQPEVTLFVELDAEHAYFFVASQKGPGGLPLGTAGRAVSLLSGGFDSPVASWRVMRRGVAIDYAFCNLGGRNHQLETLAIAKCLADRWQCGTRPRFHAIDFDAVSREIQARVAMRYWQVVLKRQMLRVAETVADGWDASAIVTGEAIGQVSSQTLQNLSVIEAGARYPVLRPLVGSNKEEIIAESKIVGTHDLSAAVGEYCAIVPRHPATHARLEDVLAEEAKLDPAVLEEALETRSTFQLSDVDLEAWSSETLDARTIGPDDTVIDLRAKSAYASWHYPGALFLDFPNALRAYPGFDPSQRYVLYCEFGLKSAHLADLMRREGLDARHVSGGLRAVRKLAEARH